MTDILSPSPYAYLDALPPAERQAEIARRQHSRRQHSRREDWCDDARRARDYQAELAELMEEFQEFQQEYVELEQLADARCAEKAFVEEERDAALSRIAELEAALEPFSEAAHRINYYDGEGYDAPLYALSSGKETSCLRELLDGVDGQRLTVSHLRAARAALRNR